MKTSLLTVFFTIQFFTNIHTSLAQFDVLSKAGSYGISTWIGYGLQQLPNDKTNSLSKFGLNAKLGSLVYHDGTFITGKILDSIREKTAEKLGTRINMVVGYQWIEGVHSSIEYLDLNYNLGGTLAGAFLTVPIFQDAKPILDTVSIDSCGKTTKRERILRIERNELSIYAGFTLSFLSSNKANGIYTGNSVSAKDLPSRTNINVIAEIPNFVMPEFEIGLAFARSFFISFLYGSRNIPNIIYDSKQPAYLPSMIDNDNSTKLPLTMDVSYLMIKIGGNFNF